MPIQRGLLLAFCLLISQYGLGQPQNRSGAGGRVVSSITEEPVIAAQVSLSQADLDAPKGAITNEQGIFRILGLQPGVYTLTILAVGFDPYERQVTLEAGPNRLGLIALNPKTVELDEVTIEGKTPAAQQQGDTTIFNAGSYKTNPDATAQDLVEKLPASSTKTVRSKRRAKMSSKYWSTVNPFLVLTPMQRSKTSPPKSSTKFRSLTSRANNHSLRALMMAIPPKPSTSSPNPVKTRESLAGYTVGTAMTSPWIPVAIATKQGVPSMSLKAIAAFLSLPKPIISTSKTLPQKIYSAW